MTYDTSAGRTRTVTAFFDSRAEAERAVDDLAAAGISRSSIRMTPSGTSGGATSATSTHDSGHGGFWDALTDLFLPDDDRSTYAEGLRRGGHLVSVSASDMEYERAIDILDREGTVNLDERESTWRQEGWTGGGYGTSGAGGSYGTAGSSDHGTTGTSGYGTTASTTGAGYGATERGVRGEEVIPIAEEHVRVGKREVSHGRVRVRSYVVETPVTEQVNLREEHVHVERRAVDRPLTGNEALFQDRTIEVEETAEEAVVSKEARVREELVVGKEVEERTKTISDTVRRTEVDIEDERGNRIGGTTGRTSDTGGRR